MKPAPSGGRAISWGFAAVLLSIGLANLLLVHPVPAAGYGIAALAYVPPVGDWLDRRLGWSVHPVARLALAVVIVLFTLGVSDLGDIVD